MRSSSALPNFSHAKLRCRVSHRDSAAAAAGCFGAAALLLRAAGIAFVAPLVTESKQASELVNSKLRTVLDCKASEIFVEYEAVDDLIGNATAYALLPGAVPLDPPEGEANKYHIESFSPGFVVDNILSKQACQKLIDLCEQIGFKKRWGPLGVTTLFLDETFERSIFNRLKHLLPSGLGGQPKGIQRRWAVIKYEPGQYMNPHVDGHVPDAMRCGSAIKHAPHTRSYMTALFWLADDVDGGETVFTFPQGGTWVKIPPKTGAALFFNHGQNAVSNPLHHGGSVRSGIKYLVRADVIY